MDSEEKLKQYIDEITSATLKNGGAAFKLDTCQFLPAMDVWTFPKYPGRTWIHPQTREFYLDIATRCADLQTARKMALEASQREERKIVAIYNSKRQETIYL